MPMQCPNIETLFAFVAGADGDAVEAHLASGCGACRRLVAQARELSRLARVDFDTPAPWVVRRAARIPREARSKAALPHLHVLARLAFDTLLEPFAAGARTASLEARQLLFEAEGYDLDVRISTSAGGTHAIRGQILPPADRDAASAAGVGLLLLAPDGDALDGVTDGGGEFEYVGLGEGTYSLLVDLPDVSLLVEELPVFS
jgi:hypothetical protein